MYESLSKFSHSQTPYHDSEEDLGLKNRESNLQYKDLSREIATMSEEWKVMMNCDEVLTLYLREASQKTNEMFY